MLTELYYFSGTGNSLYLARETALRLRSAVPGDQVDLISIASLSKEQRINSQADCIGVFFPVYFSDIPDIVCSFLERLSAHQVSYLFIVDNCGAVDGSVLSRARKITLGHGLPLSAGFRFLMPDNSVVFPTDVLTEKKFLDAATLGLDEMATAIRERKQYFQMKAAFASPVLTVLMKRICFSVLGFRDLRANPTLCTGCGLCASVCPAGNIEMHEKKPLWKSKKECTSCFACLHYCPTQAISFRLQAKKSGFQYRNPNVALAEMKLR